MQSVPPLRESVLTLQLAVINRTWQRWCRISSTCRLPGAVCTSTPRASCAATAVNVSGPVSRRMGDLVEKHEAVLPCWPLRWLVHAHSLAPGWGWPMAALARGLQLPATLSPASQLQAVSLELLCLGCGSISCQAPLLKRPRSHQKVWPVGSAKSHLFPVPLQP